jgi:hypothetical protein
MFRRKKAVSPIVCPITVNIDADGFYKELVAFCADFITSNLSPKKQEKFIEAFLSKATEQALLRHVSYELPVITS